MKVTVAPDAADDIFERERPRLLGLAYRMLSVIADAEDVVQEAWLRWHGASHDAVQNPEAWLTTVTTRLALDRLRAQRRRREAYVGPWLPEPVVLDDGPEQRAELADTLTLGFLTMLDRLGPVERAVFLLADVFGSPFSEVAAAVGKSEVACRQIASRARRRLRDGRARPRSGPERAVVDEMLLAVAQGDVEAVLNRLAPDVLSISDGGALRRAARRPVVGAERVARLFVNLARKAPPDAGYQPVTVNGDPGLLVTVGGDVEFLAAFEVDGGKIAAIWIMRNPEKLEHVLERVGLT